MKTLTENVPSELRALRRWVCAEADSKIPMQVGRPRPASVNDPSTWGEFREAEECLRRGLYEYAGFVFAADGYVGIDIDRAFSPSGLLDDDALRAVAACRSYTEVSKGGSGLHIICKGSLPFRGRNNREGWEAYREGRFFVLTGRIVAFPRVREARKAVEAILAAHFPSATRPGGRAERRPPIWPPRWAAPEGGLVRIEPDREAVGEGARHMAMLSFCGQLRSSSVGEGSMLDQALAANERYMRPPLPKDEVESIVRSIERYGG